MRSRKWPPQRIAGWLAALCIAFIVLMLGKPYFSNASRPQRGIDDPVLGLQMAVDVSDVDAILADSPSPDRETMRLKQYIDFGFILCYAALYVVLSVLLATTYPQRRWVAILAAICGLAAAIYDVSENFAILRVCAIPLSATTQGMVDAIRHASLAKWTLAFAGLALISTYFLQSKGWKMKTVGIAAALTGVAGFYGVIEHPFLPYAMVPMTVAFAGIALLYFR